MKILIIDIETTGFLKQGGKICEVGMVALDITTGEREVVYSCVINPMLSREKLEDSWIVKNGYMTAEEIMAGEDWDDIKLEVQVLIDSYELGATAFNRSFDFNFLHTYGIKFKKPLPCPMLLSTAICKLPNKNGYGGYKWPNVEEAYKHFYPESNYVETHRGGDDALHEADIVYALYKLGVYRQTLPSYG